MGQVLHGSAATTAAVTGDVLINVETSSHQQQPDLVATQDGGFFVTWIANT